MPRKSSSRLELRRQAEALEARGEAAEAAAPKKATKKAPAARAKRTREKAPIRKRLVWVVYNGSLKEEARFPYDQYAAAEEKIEQLRQKSKKMYFIHPLKEPLSDVAPKIDLGSPLNMSGDDDDFLEEPPEELAAEFEEEAEIEDEEDEEEEEDDDDSDE